MQISFCLYDQSRRCVEIRTRNHKKGVEILFNRSGPLFFREKRRKSVRKTHHSRFGELRANMEALDVFGELLEKASEGDSVAIEQLLGSYRPYLFAIADEDLPCEFRSEASASDLVQLTLFEAVQGLARFPGRQEGQFRAWIRQILRNNLNNIINRHRRGGPKVSLNEARGADRSGHGIQIPAPAADTSQALREEERRMALMRAMEKLSPLQRQVVRLRCFEDRTYPQIGAALKRSYDSVRKIFERAINELAGILGDESL